jgi:hypothetical protein
VLLRGAVFPLVSMVEIHSSGADENLNTIANCERSRKLVGYMAFQRGNSVVTSDPLFRNVV